MVRWTHQPVEMLAEYGVHIPLAVEERKGLEARRRRQHRETLEQVTAAVAVTADMLEGQEVSQVVQVVVAAETQLAAVQAELEPEARCEYGPGSSEQCRTQRPGCAEA